MLATDAHQPRQVHRAFVGGKLVQRQDQWRITEKIGGLSHFRGQLPVERFKVASGQLHHSDGKHAALELKYRFGVLRFNLAHG